MTSKQYLAALHALHWTHEKAGEHLGYAGRSSMRYAYGEVRIPRTVAACLRALVDAQLSGKTRELDWLLNILANA